MEGAFSRNRSFSNKFRKYGAYVPRGEVGPEEQRRKQQQLRREGQRPRQ